MACYHLGILLKKNLKILKRSYILTFFEIFSPILVMLILWLTKSKFKAEHIPINIDYSYKNCTSTKTSGRAYCYYRGILNHCSNKIIALIGQNFPYKIESKIKEHFWEAKQSDLGENPEIKYYDNLGELTDYIESKDYLYDKKVCFGISYQKNNQKYTFKIHYFDSSYSKEDKDGNKINIPSSGNNYDSYKAKPDFDSFHSYINSGFLVTQNILYNYVLQNELNDNYAEIHYRIIPQLYEEKTYNLLNNYLKEIVSIFVLVAYAFPLSINIYRLVQDKETRVKEIMKIMGLNELNYFLSNFIIYFFINIFYALINSLILHKILYVIDVKYLFGFLFFYGLVIYSMVFFFQSFLEKARISIIFCLLVYSIMYFLGFSFHSNGSNKALKVFFSLLFPPIALQLGTNTMTFININYYEFDGRIYFNHNNFSISDSYVVFIFNIILYMFIGFYLQNVLQHEYGISKPWNFLFTKNFWDCSKKFKEEKDPFLNISIEIDNVDNNNYNIEKPKKINNIREDINTEVLSSNTFINEPAPLPNKKKGVFKIKNIKKSFGDKIVLEDISFDLYENEIFVLLGSNGAGKTTLISILTGLICPNGGKAIYKGKNILSSDIINHFRKLVGICPQYDVLFNNLTVEEHLELYCEFKSVEQSKIPKEINAVLNNIGLSDKRSTKASDLSGGQKRKLSIGLAIVGGSSIIILDEPTSGMDITSRRNLWDILKRCLTGKIIILSTHFMEEASVLGNRVGILTEGKIKAEHIGSPLELIEKHTKNINLNITKHSDADNDVIIKFIEDNLGHDLDIEKEIFNKEILFRIPVYKNINWSEFFQKFDNEKKKMKIKNYSIAKSTLEDVFINISKEKNKIKNSSMKFREIFEEQNKICLKNSVIMFDQNNYNKNIDCYSKFKRDFIISFKKRLYQIKREKKIFILEIICPILLILIGCFVGRFEVLHKNKPFPLHLNQITKGNQIIYYSIDKSYYNYIYNYKAHENLDKVQYEYIYNPLSSDLSISLEILDELKKENNFQNYIYYTPININEINNLYSFNLIVDIGAKHAAPIYANFLLNNVVRYALWKQGKPDVEIEMINEPLPQGYDVIKDRKKRNELLIIFFITLAFSLIPSNFITIIIKEKENNSKHLQIISGIFLFSYWFNNYIFELIKYYLVGGICLLLLLAFDFYEKYFYILYFEYGPAMISFTYFFSIFFKSEYIGQILILVINLIFGVVLGIAVITMRLSELLVSFSNKLAYVFRLIPSFSFSYSYSQLVRKRELFILKMEMNNDVSLYDDIDIDDNILSLKFVIADCVYLAFESVVYLIFLAIFEMIFNININCCNDDANDEEPFDINNNNKDLFKSRIEIPNKKYAIKVHNLAKTYYGKCCNPIPAVKNISFFLDYGEIFGFLGVNGAGKTTTFKCLSNEILPSSGNIYINDLNLSQNFNNIRNLIGYCPQVDAIFDYLTVYENLEFYGLLKGAKKYKLNIIIDALIEELNLTDFKDKISSTLSGGNKRKLSVAIALICNPPIILLDEPSTGMDPEVRRNMWKAINNVSICNKRSAIIMTTHSMEEAETLCKIIGILVDGEFKCLGTSDEIKDKYGFGFEIKLNIIEPYNNEINKIYKKFGINFDEKNKYIDINGLDDFLEKYGLNKYRILLKKKNFGRKIMEEMKLKEIISANRIVLWLYYLKCVLGIIKLIKVHFEEIICVDYDDNNFNFKIKRNKKKDEKTIGFLFGLIEDNKNEFKIGFYSLQYSSLEQIFNKFAKEKEDNEINEIEVEIGKDFTEIFDDIQ